jgi:hypothetical protein
MKKTMKYVFIIIALSILCIGFVNAWAEIYPVTSQTTQIPSDLNAFQEPDSGVEIRNVTIVLNYWNERMHWGLSQKQISEYSIEAENQILKNLTTVDGKWYHIKNLTRFDEEIGAIIGLSDVQISAFIIEERKQLEIDHMNYFKETPIQSPEKTESLSTVLDISKNSPSVPPTNERNLYPGSANTSLSGFGFPLGICSVLISLLMITMRKRG